MTNLFPSAQCGIGPATDEGFFYDFVVDRPFVPEDLDAIEKKMKALASEDLPFERQMWPREEAIRFFADRGEPLKVQLIEEKTAGQPDVSCYTIKDRDTFVDFCVGPHVPSTGRLKAFKLLNTSNAYWKGDAQNQPMQRIYGTAFLSDKELQAHLQRIEEAKKRDHRKLGKELGLFIGHPWAPGRHVLARQGHDALQHARRLHAQRAVPGRLPGSEDADHLQQGVVGDVGSLVVLPREHVPRAVVGQRGDGAEVDELPRAFPRLRQRDAQLPRSADAVPRADAAPSQRGVGRAVRAHARPPVLAGRCALLRDGVADRRRSRAAAAARAAGLRRLRAALHGEAGDAAREVPRRRSRRGITPKPRCARRWTPRTRRTRSTKGDGAFYGPKLDFDITDAIGRQWQCATIQLDYQMPERFDLKYIGADNTEHRPVVIHRAIFGSFERFIAILIEHYAGAFPLWLAPVQVRVLPIADRHADYARSVRDALAAAGLRVEVDERQEKIGFKIREAQLQKIPYMLVTGDREVAERTVSVRSRSGGDQGARRVDELIRQALAEIAAKGEPEGLAAAS